MGQKGLKPFRTLYGFSELTALILDHTLQLRMEKRAKRIVLVEDEVLIADGLQLQLEELGYDVCAHAMDYDEALEMVEQHQPDLVILDINLEAEKSGIDVGQHILENYQIPFVYLTSQLDAATLHSAKDTLPAGYLTKPYYLENLYATIEVALHNYEQNKGSKEDKRVFLKTGKLNESVNMSDILYIKVDHVYIEVVLESRTLLVRMSLREIMELLPQDEFLQVHRSYLVNIAHVISFGMGQVYLTGNSEVPVSRKHQKELLNTLGIAS